MTAVIVGIGQDAAGDDGVGLVVARACGDRGVVVRTASDASVLLPLLEAGHRVVMVDAVVGGGAPGSVLRLDPAALATGPRPLSSHGIGVAEAIELARTLYGDDAIAGLAIVGIVIERPRVTTIGLSPEVVAAIPQAVALTVELAGAST